MGCVLYELATRKRAFNNDWAVVEHRYERKNKDVVLEDIFDAGSKDILTKYIVDMLQIEASARPSASVLSKEFTRLARVLPTADVHSGISSATMASVTDQTDRTLTTTSTPQKPRAVPKQTAPNRSIPSSRSIEVELYRAAERGDFEVVMSLITAKVDVNAKGGQFGNALQAASNNGHEAVL